MTRACASVLAGSHIPVFDFEMAPFDIPITTNPEQTLNQVRDQLAKNKGTLEGDITGGQFSAPSPFGDVRGTYTFVEDKAVRVTITEKPFLLSDSLIKSVLSENV